MLSKFKNLDKRIYFFIASSVVFTFLLSFTSPIMIKHYYFDDNAFLTVGRILKHGGVLYKDVFEQKGPLFLFLFYLQELISEKYYVFLFLINALLNFCILYFSYEYTYSVTKSSAKSYVVSSFAIGFYYALAYSMLIPESFIYTIFLYLIYTLNKNINNGENYFTNVQYIINGLLISFMLFTKFLLSFSLIIMYLALFVILIKNKKFSQLIKSIYLTAIGVVALCIPVFIYFWVNKYLHGFIYDYIIVNYKYYGVTNLNSTLSNSFNRDLTFPLSIFQNVFKSFTQYFQIDIDFKTTILKICSTLTVLYLIIKKSSFKTDFYVLFISLFIGYVYGEYFGKYSTLYYLLPGFAFTTIVLANVINKFELKVVSKVSLIVIPLIVTLFVQPSVWLNSKLYRDSRPTDTELHAQYISSKKSNPKILQIYLDEGIFLQTNATPMSKFFYVPNKFDNYDKLWNSYLKFIKNKQADYVIVERKVLRQNAEENKVFKKILSALQKNYKQSKSKYGPSKKLLTINRLWEKK